MACNKLLYNKDYLITQGEIAEILLEEGYFNEAIKEAETALMKLPHLNAEAVKFNCVLMRAYYSLGKELDAQHYFD